VEQGVIVDFDSMEHLWTFAFQDLGADPAGQSVLLTDSP
jgi:hypothetical protein